MIFSKQKGSISVLVALSVGLCLGAGSVFIYNKYSTVNKDKVTTPDRAIELVKNNSADIEKWIKTLNESKKKNPAVGTPTFSAEKIDDHTYMVHVFENQIDHAATKGWYYVDTKTERVSEVVN